MKITVIQPAYHAGENPDERIAEFLINELKNAQGELIVLPEYSNAGGTSNAEDELRALPRAAFMLDIASEQARIKRAYVCINA